MTPDEKKAIEDAKELLREGLELLGEGGHFMSKRAGVEALARLQTISLSDEHMLTLDDYQARAARTRVWADGSFSRDGLANYALGLAGEAGEAVDHVKKFLFHDHPLDSLKLAKELGDAVWCIAGLAALTGTRLSEVAEGNLRKLAARYPAGFSGEASRSRKEDA